MSLRTKILLVNAATTVILIVGLLLAVRGLLLPHFLEEQDAAVHLNLERLEGAIQNDFTVLDQTIRDWAKWDDTYAFVQDANQEYVESNLQPATFADLHVHWMVFVGADGGVVFDGIYDPDSGQVQPSPLSMAAHLGAGSPLLPDPGAMEGKQGFLAVADAPMLVVSHPILHTEGGGPPLGALIMGRYLDAQEVAQFANVLQFPVSIHRLGGGEPVPGDVSAALENILASGASHRISPSDDRTVSGYLLLRDVYDQPAYIFSFQQPSTVHQAGIVLINLVITILIAAGLIFFLVFSGAMEVMVLAPLRRLNQQVTEVGTTGDLSRRVTVHGRDELGQLSESINRTLAALQEAQRMGEENRERFRTLVNSMDELVFTLNRERTEMHFYGRQSARFRLAESVDPGEFRDLLDRVSNFSLHHEMMERAMAGESISYDFQVDFDKQKHHFVNSVAPIHNPRGEIVGVVGVAQEISNLKQLEFILRQRVTELTALYEVSRLFLSQLDTTAALANVCRLAVQRFGLDAAWVGEPLPSGSRMRVLSSYGAMPIDAASHMVRIESGGLVNPALLSYQNGRVVTLNRFSNDDTRPIGPTGRLVQSLICLPLQQNGQSIAALTAYSREEGYFTPERLQFLQSFANLASAALQSARLFEQVLSGRQRLQDLSRRLVEVQDQERLDTVEELREEMDRIFSDLGTAIQPETLPDPLVLQQELETARERTRTFLERASRKRTEPRASLLEARGLIPTLQWLINRYSTRHGMSMQLDAPGLDENRFPFEVELTAYRLVQEALTIIAQNSHVQSLQLQVQHLSGLLEIRIVKPTEGGTTDPTLHRLLLDLRQHLAAFRGDVQIETHPGGGETYIFHIPLQD